MQSDYDLNDINIVNIEKEYMDFLDDDNDTGTYTRMVKDMTMNNEVRLFVNINDLRKKNPKRAIALLNSSFIELLAFEKALRDFVYSINPEYRNKFHELFIGLEGSFGSKHVTPRTLTSHFLGQIVCVEGIVTRCSLVRPKVVKSVHYCPTTHKVIERKYTDLTSYEAYPSSSVYPTKDDDGNLLETEYGLSIYKDHQTFTIQEMPEKAPPGQLPRSIDIIADNDLVDTCKPGDRVQVVGTFRCLPSKQGNYTNCNFRTILLANNIQLLSKEVSPLISPEDIQKCKKFCNQKGQDVFEVLSRSLAPSIHGHEMIKKAILCMLLGGVEKVLPNGTRLRGDINVLLIGDPSVAKSQLLRYVLHSAPRAIPTTGRGSSGVGLTAAVTTDFETGDRRLEAGAMVLGDRGVVCIDEFDKMSDIDRTAIHEVMEQGRVTITKAGIHAKLNARCSVLAAANPVYGRYDEMKTPMENIGLQDSLLSRFDLLFIVLDKKDTAIDTQIAEHVVRMHRYRNPNEQDGEPMPIISVADFLSTKDIDAYDESETPIYDKYDKLLHGNRSKSDKVVSVKFMKKYIHIAKSMKPSLTSEAAALIAEEYSNLRVFENEHSDLARTQPVTARTLETMIRLATAHAKARLSRQVEKQDAETAIELIHFAYFKKVLEKKKRKKEAEGETDDEEEEEIIDDETEDTIQLAKKTMRKRKTPIEEDDDITEQLEDSVIKAKQAKRTTTIEPTEEIPLIEITDERLKQFKSSLYKEFKKAHAQSLALDNIKESLSSDYSEEEINSCLNRMQDDNQIMLAKNMVILI